jgi:hypothetical protein
MSADPADQVVVTMPISKAARDVLAERLRQAAPPPGGEGYSAAHDDRLIRNQLSRAAVAYIQTAISSPDAEAFWAKEWWPRGWGHAFKPKGERSDLVRAAALLIAHIERLDRIAARP